MFPKGRRHNNPVSWLDVAHKIARRARRPTRFTAGLAKRRLHSSILGSRSLRLTISDPTEQFLESSPKADTEITLVGDPVKALYYALRAVTMPGDEVVVFAPVSLHYRTILSDLGIIPRIVTTPRPELEIHNDDLTLAWAFTPRTRAILLDMTSHPTRRTFSQEELGRVAALCRKWDVFAISDETDVQPLHENPQFRISEIPGMASQTVTIRRLATHADLSSFSERKDYRLSWLIAPSVLTETIHRLQTRCLPPC